MCNNQSVIYLLLGTFQLIFQLSDSQVVRPKNYVDGEECNRVCDGKPKNCFYHFHVEVSYSMSKACYNCPEVLEHCFRRDCIVGGGLERTLLVVNRQLPGPSILACKGDNVKILVENKMQSGEATSFHWHGLSMVKDPYMDGVPFVTQCPIPNNNNFTYEFNIAESGTYFWHSHHKMQRGEGIFGPLIIKDSSAENTHKDLYDHDLPEHIMMVGDWNDRSRLDAYNAYSMGPSKLMITGVLVNGLGYQFTNGVNFGPLATFTVEKGKRYRFRMINPSFFDSPYEITIDNHTMKVIASDGSDVKPVEVTSIVATAGERYDFIIEANQPSQTYWIRVKTFLQGRYKQIRGVALLKYKDSTQNLPEIPVPTYDTAANISAIVLNPMSKVEETRTVITIDQLQAVNPMSSKLQAKNVKHKFYLSFEMNPIDTPCVHGVGYGYNEVAQDFKVRAAQINNIAHEMSPIPLLPNRFKIDNKTFCTSETIKGKNCSQNYCSCPHVLQIELGATVELIFSEPNATAGMIRVLHPIHLHGYHFYVLGWGEIGENVTREDFIKLDEQGKLKRNFNNPPFKDTVTVPQGGYTIVRFVADNPGYWLLHCHIEVHSDKGMELVLQVGSPADMQKTPNGFPQCGNYPKPKLSK